MRLAMRYSPSSALAAAAFTLRRPFSHSRSLARYSPIVVSSSSLFSVFNSGFKVSSSPITVNKLALEGQRRRWCSGVRAAHVSDPGSIDSPLILSMQNKIKAELEADSVIVQDAYGDGRHVSIVVIAKAFEGQSPVKRQRMVYKAIWDELQSTVHAVDHMSTLTPDEAQAQSSSSSFDS
ncbi:bolA-like family protein [Carex rostrata]